MKSLRYLVPLFLAVVLTSLLSSSALAAQAGRVMKVSDGDTVVISPSEGGAFVKCRLYGIDSPEIRHGRKPGQPYGEEASRELKQLILGQDVDIDIINRDRYGRSVCRIYKDRTDVNLEMVNRGYAWAYVQYLKRPHASEYIDAEKGAREKRLGLWKDNNPTPPWEFRKLQRGGR
ncbi:MAG: thermonuclease family protein [Thermodesulfovibrionales bacterium]